MSQDQFLKEHRDSWSGFVKLISWSVASVVVVLLGMAFFLL